MDRHGERLQWPFFGDEHRRLAAEAEDWAGTNLGDAKHPQTRAAVDARCRELVAALGKAGFLKHCLRAADGGVSTEFDARSICVLREALAYRDGLADFAFAMQGLGSAPVSLAGSAEMRSLWLPRVAAGTSIAAFALSEPAAGSDVAAMETAARLDGPQYVLNGQKTWISNGGIADFYVVFARTAPGSRRPDGSVSAEGISAFLVKPGDSGFTVAERIDAMAPHPLGRLVFEDCRIPAARLIGAEGEGFKIAMRTLDVFRTSVAAAACGFARRALDEALAHARGRGMFGRRLADFQLTQAALAEMATALDGGDAAHLPRRMAARHRARVHRGRRDGEAHRDGKRAGRHRPRAADVRRPRRRERRARRAAVPGDPGAAHLRRGERGAEAHRRPGAAEMSREILQPPGWARPRGYANGVAAEGRQVFVAGQIGWDAEQRFVSDDFALQTRQALSNVIDVLACAGAGPAHVVRLTWYVTSRDEYNGALAAIGAIYRELFGRNFPAMSVVVVAGLLEPRAKVEIEATAVV